MSTLRNRGSVIGESIPSSNTSTPGIWEAQEEYFLVKENNWQVPSSITVTANIATVDEGNAVLFAINTYGFANNISIPYIITGANVYANDFTINRLTGNFIVNHTGVSPLAGAGNITLVANADGLLESAEVMTLSVGRASVSVTISGYLFIEYLVVGGGGGGGGYVGGGGGAGGYRTGVLAIPVSANSANIIVTVGAGGTGTLGANSVFSSISALGGGNGATGGGGQTLFATEGGSGGGAGSSAGNSMLAGAGTAGQGNAGGTSGGGTGNFASGGGGGGGGVGDSVTAASIAGGNGGIGLSSSISGIATYYAGGGGGCISNNAGGGAVGSNGKGGVGGGGDASRYISSGADQGGGTPGVVNTGGGGGAGGASGSTTYPGGSGIVIIRYADIYSAATTTTGSPNVTVSGGYRIYKWTSSGSIIF